jgi:transposase InsO family protein
MAGESIANVFNAFGGWKACAFQPSNINGGGRGTVNGSIIRHAARHRLDVWSYDFVMDTTEDGRRLKMLPIVDEFSRECLTVEVARHLTAKDVIGTLSRLFKEHGAPRYLRSDNGPELVARSVKEWLAQANVETLYIEPGSPWQNAYVESFNSRFRDELLDREIFTTLVEAKVLVSDYVRQYNVERPHSALEYRTPAAFVAAQTQTINSVVQNGL